MNMSSKAIEKNESRRKTNKRLRRKIKKLEKANFALGEANIRLLAIREYLVSEDDEYLIEFNKRLCEKMKKLEKANYDLGKANVQLLEIIEQLENGDKKKSLRELSERDTSLDVMLTVI